MQRPRVPYLEVLVSSCADLAVLNEKKVGRYLRYVHVMMVEGNGAQG